MATPCGDQTPFELLTDPEGANLWYAIQCAYESVPTLDPAILSVFVFGTVALMYYTSGRSIVIPMVLALMLGGIVVATLPPIAQSVAVVVTVFGVAVGVMYLVYRAKPVR